MNKNNLRSKNYLKIGGDPEYILLWNHENSKFEIDEKTAKQTGKLIG